jgi:hypothetical protein
MSRAASPIPPLADEIRRVLARLCAAGPLELSEDSETFPQLSSFQFEARDEPRGTYLHLWSEDANLVRRVLRVLECSNNRLLLEVSRFGRAKPSQLEIALRSAAQPTHRLSREKFRARFRRLLEQQFPDEQIDALTTAADLEHSLSGSYVRGTLCRGQSEWALLGAAPAEEEATLDAMLTFGLLWLERCRARASRRVVEGLRLFFPDDGGEPAATRTAHRMAALQRNVRTELFIFDARNASVQRVDSQDRGNLQTELAPHREFERVRSEAQGVAERLIALAPDAVDLAVRISRAGVATEAVFRYWGLEFARWHTGRLFLLMGPDASILPGEREWTGNWQELESLIALLARFRHAQAEDRNHPLYRARPERWLERMVASDATRIDAQLNPEHLYSQVPSLGPGRGILDLLGVTRDGRLAVIELKATEDLHLVLQGAEYWLRVRWHLEQRDFERNGYFRGIELQRRPPLLYLVAPGLRFHPATEVLLKYLSPEIELTRIGTNEDWRRGLQVVFRQSGPGRISA